MKRSLILTIGLLFSGFTLSHAQTSENKWEFENKHFLGSQVFMLFANYTFDPSPEYYEINYGYRFSSRDEISIELKTWAYQGPLGRPYGSDYESASSGFPGDIKATGGGLAYKRMLWKGVFTQLHVTGFHQTYRDENKKKIQSGFQLFNTLRFGYHIKLFKNKRLFFAPSIAFTTWPINTNLPESFQIEEDKWPSYFLFEPGFQFGYAF